MVAFHQGHALIIGVGADLPNTVGDAIGLVDPLNAPARCGCLPNQICLLTGENAGRSQILPALDALAQVTNTQSAAIIFFSGHGCRVTSPTGEFFYLIALRLQLEPAPRDCHQ